MQFKLFQAHVGLFRSEEECLHEVLEKAAAFASTLAPDELVGFSQSMSGVRGAFVTVWYRPHQAPPSPTAIAEATLDERELQAWLGDSRGGEK